MNIIIVGGGKVGRALCKDLSLTDNNVTMIELRETVLERTISRADIDGFVGNGADIDIQKEAGVEHCDIFIAVTPEDETNIIAASIAKNLGATHTIARVRKPAYATHNEFMHESMGITLMINPEYEAASQIVDILRYPGALSVENFSDGVHLIEVMIEDDELSGLMISRFRQKFPNLIICAIKRGDEVVIPTGDTMIKRGDHLFVTGEQELLANFYHVTGKKKKRLKNTLIIGGSRISHYLIDMLKDVSMGIKVIEINPDKASELSEHFPEVVVINGDGSDQEFLQEERIELFDAIVSLTGVDEENLLISLFARRNNLSKVITKVNRTDLINLIEEDPSHAFVTPHQLISNHISKFVRSVGSRAHSDIEGLYRVDNNQFEIIEFHITKESELTNQPIHSLPTKSDVLIANIIRDGHVIFPTGADDMQVDDHVIIATTRKYLTSLEDILE